MKVVIAEFSKPLRFLGQRTATTSTIDLNQQDHRRLVESMTVDPATMIVSLVPGPEARFKGLQLIRAERVTLAVEEPTRPTKVAK